jgi:hypothetical protein
MPVWPSVTLAVADAGKFERPGAALAVDELLRAMVPTVAAVVARNSRRSAFCGCVGIMRVFLFVMFCIENDLNVLINLKYHACFDLS